MPRWRMARLGGTVTSRCDVRWAPFRATWTPWQRQWGASWSMHECCAHGTMSSSCCGRGPSPGNGRCGAGVQSQATRSPRTAPTPTTLASQYLKAFIETTKADIRCLHHLLSRHVLIPGQKEAQRQEEARRAEAVAAASAASAADLSAAVAGAYPYTAGGQELFNPVRQWADFTVDLETKLQSISVEVAAPGGGQGGGSRRPHPPSIRHTATSTARIKAHADSAAQAPLPSLTALASQPGGAALHRTALRPATLTPAKMALPSGPVAALRRAGTRRALQETLGDPFAQRQAAQDEALLSRMQGSSVLTPPAELKRGLEAEGGAGGPPTISFDFGAITQLLALKEHLMVELCRFLLIRKGELERSMGLQGGVGGGQAGDEAPPPTPVVNDPTAPHRRNNHLAYRGVDAPPSAMARTVHSVLAEQTAPDTTGIIRATPATGSILRFKASAAMRRFMSLAGGFLELEGHLRQARLAGAAAEAAGGGAGRPSSQQAQAVLDLQGKLRASEVRCGELQAQLRVLRHALSGVHVPHVRGSQLAGRSGDARPYVGMLDESGDEEGGSVTSEVSRDFSQPRWRRGRRGDRPQPRGVGGASPSEATLPVASAEGTPDATDARQCSARVTAVSATASQLFVLGVRLDEAVMRLRSASEELQDVSAQRAALLTQVGHLSDANAQLRDSNRSLTRELALYKAWFGPRIRQLEEGLLASQQGMRDARASMDLLSSRLGEVLDAKGALEAALSAVTQERNTLAAKLHESVKNMRLLKYGEVARLETVNARLRAAQQATQAEYLALKRQLAELKSERGVGEG